MRTISVVKMKALMRVITSRWGVKRRRNYKIQRNIRRQSGSRLTSMWADRQWNEWMCPRCGEGRWRGSTFWKPFVMTQKRCHLHSIRSLVRSTILPRCPHRSSMHPTWAHFFNDRNWPLHRSSVNVLSIRISDVLPKYCSFIP